MLKKLVLTAVLMVGFGMAIFAQSSSQTATLTVIINNAIALNLTDVNPTLIFDEASDFVNGVTYSASPAGDVTATRAFDVTVAASGADLDDGFGNTIPVSSVAVEPTGAGLGTTSQVSLSTADQTIINNAPAAVSQPFGLTYSTAPNDPNFVNKPSGTYNVTLTYTATLD
ncbi:MAG: hypothetical protein KDC24_11625 [Saprospiraceae bacterium]|nr:hypothetical protein [Saprospiraceae bacterium]